MASNVREPISTDELKRLGEALKDDKFRQLLLEYAEEIRDPQNRQRYEQELSILERERGVNLTFVHPEAGYVIKTITNDGTKTFINICKNKNVAKPSCSRSKLKSGLDWSVPYFLSPPRDDIDKSGRKCRIFDVVFHSDTIYMAQRNARFRKMIEDTALEGIQQTFTVCLDRKNLHYPKLKYKGHPFPTVLRKPVSDATVSELTENFQNATIHDSEKCGKENHENEIVSSVKEPDSGNNGTLVPKYSLRYQNRIDMESFTVLAQQSANVRPNAIVVDIQLPFSDSAKGIDIDVVQQTLIVKSSGPVSYNLDLPLPFPVDDEQGKAQFDQSLRTLTVTLPVRPFVPPEPIRRVDISVTEREMPTTAKINENDAPSTHHCMMGNLCLPSHAYDLPPFEVNQSNEAITFLFHVTKIHPESIETQVCDCGYGFQVIFMSTSDSNWYSFCMASDNHLQLEQLQCDISDLNMAVRLLKSKDEEWWTLEYGCYEATGYTHQIINQISVLKKFQKLKDDTERSVSGSTPIGNEQVQVKEVTEESLKLEIILQTDSKQSSEADTEEEPWHNVNEFSQKIRTSSESSQELCPLRSRRGILKYPRNWRSISESSDDLNYCSTLDMLPPSPEEDDDPLSGDKMPKKNVRFNDHVAKNIFRANSSILGQKKKNQKRAQYKKRVAAQRSSSQEESESHDSAATTEDDSEHISTDECHTEKPKKKKNRSKAVKNTHKNIQEQVNSSDSLVDYLIAESKEDVKEMEAVIEVATAQSTESMEVDRNSNDLVENSTEDAKSLQHEDNYNSEDVSVDERNDEMIVKEETPLENKTENSVQGTEDVSVDERNDEMIVKEETPLENKTENSVQGTENDKVSLKKSDIGDRTCSNSLLDLDFRTSCEDIIELCLPPDNTAFHLD